GNTEIRLVFLHLGQQMLGVHGPYPFVNVEPIRRAANFHHLGTKLTKNMGSDMISCPMGGIYDQFDPGKVEVIRKSTFAKLNIAASSIGNARCPSQPI